MTCPTYAQNKTSLKKYQLKNAETIYSYKQRWYITNKEVVREQQRIYRAKKKQEKQKLIEI